MDNLQENVKPVETVTTEIKDTGAKVTAEPSKKPVTIEKKFTQAEIDTMIEKRLARAKKDWEKSKVDVKLATDQPKTNEADKQVKDLQIKLAKYEQDLTLAKYPVEEEFVDFVKFKILRSVSKDKSYQVATDEFFADENNQRYLKGNSGQGMPRPQNIGSSDQDPIRAKYGNVKPLNKGRI